MPAIFHWKTRRNPVNIKHYYCIQFPSKYDEIHTKTFAVSGQRFSDRATDDKNMLIIEPLLPLAPYSMVAEYSFLGGKTAKA